MAIPPNAEDLDSPLAELARREPIFHRADFGRTLDDFDRLMAPTYWEVGASGHRYSRAFVLQHLAANPPVDADAAGWTTTGFACQPLGPEIWLLTYALTQGDRLTRRATIWRNSPQGWQILYHQGTISLGALGHAVKE